MDTRITLPTDPVASIETGTVVDAMLIVVVETGTTVTGSFVVTPSCERPSTATSRSPELTPLVQSNSIWYMPGSTSTIVSSEL